MIERIETACYRLPLAEPVGDAGHGAIDTEELIVVTVYADGLSGQGYAYTIGRGGP
ncbi:MAG: uroporphyrinogen decarboxylase, partial [Chloroflexota bacterium]